MCSLCGSRAQCVGIVCLVRSSLANSLSPTAVGNAHAFGLSLQAFDAARFVFVVMGCFRQCGEWFRSFGVLWESSSFRYRIRLSGERKCRLGSAVFSRNVFRAVWWRMVFLCWDRDCFVWFFRPWDGRLMRFRGVAGGWVAGCGLGVFLRDPGGVLWGVWAWRWQGCGRGGVCVCGRVCVGACARLRVSRARMRVCAWVRACSRARARDSQGIIK